MAVRSELAEVQQKDDNKTDFSTQIFSADVFGPGRSGVKDV